MRAQPSNFRTAALLLGLGLLAACGGKKTELVAVPGDEFECMARAMYFESNRSSRDGMIAVGNVVMNRVHSEAFPNTVCGVVGQPKQFAPGVMTKPMNDRSAPLARASALAVLQGERHPKVTRAKFFHAAWYKANYNNMHYVVTAGGNAFYEKRRPELVTTPNPLPPLEGITPH
ncbi:Spore cortex-lytic enzyme [Sulfitobacter sp. DSM 110093]|uniref:cell wall hydrolase n=1 Tax=Sulfitobacter sp. DSM 110093 TaxID=2883127 RepID=UPI001FABD205|nr:cell wall hydrolase [Sulfitobacter sp. DSM 110093]UOA32504.1 Spore cortex-lytic enzyme [Sulfitobacter sp. DSM 110093]